MIIVGGTYAERCRYPVWDQIYGSGLRAAVAVSKLSQETVLHTFVPDAWQADVQATLESVGLLGKLHRTEQVISFGYLHPFELIDEPEAPTLGRPTIEAAGDVLLQFGMIEGDAKVEGRRVVYDPQSSGQAFGTIGSHADMLALIVTKSELLQLIGRRRDTIVESSTHDQVISDAVLELRDMGGQPPSIVLVKDGLGGLLVYEGDNPFRINSYCAESYFRIGSGDVLAAAFAHAWGEKTMRVNDAADYAARCVSYFVEGPRLPLPEPSTLLDRRQSGAAPEHIRIVALGDLDLQSLAFHTQDWIRHLGGSASHESFENDVMRQDVTNLILIGASTTRDKLEQLAAIADHNPTIIYWADNRSNLGELYFPHAQVTSDYATALYRTMRRFEK